MTRKASARVARSELAKLLEMGMTQREIATALKLNESTISRIRNVPEWMVSEQLANSLRSLRVKISQKRAVSLLENAPLQVIETCNRRAVAVDDAKAAEVAKAVAEAITEAVTDAVSGALSGEPGQVRLPAGIQGALVQVGPTHLGLYLIAVDTNLTTDDRRRVLAHELQHLRQRLLEGVRTNLATATPESEY